MLGRWAADRAHADSLGVTTAPLKLTNGEFNIADLHFCTDLQRRRRAGGQGRAVYGSPVGRTEILDLQRVSTGEGQPGMTARYGSVRYHQFALTGRTTDRHALRRRHQLVERHIEAELLAGRIDTLEAQADLRQKPGCAS